jgi:hypothetical protein
VSIAVPDLWSLVLDHQEVDPDQLIEAIEDQVKRADLDFRSRLLIRDSLDVLRERWGLARVHAWLEKCSQGGIIAKIWLEELGDVGFPSLTRRIVEPTRPEAIRQLLREIGQRIHPRKPLRLIVGGSGALILRGVLSRRTEDIDIVDELPPELRSEQALLNELKGRYNLYLGHFQSHYLPSGWENRVQFLDGFGDLQVYLVDVYDIVLSKLFSNRTKDLDDLRFLTGRLDKKELIDRLKRTTAALMAVNDLRKSAQQNWYILFGEETLPQ